MNFPKLPNADAKSLSFLTFAVVGLILFNNANDIFTKLFDLVITLFSFLLASLHFIKNNIVFPFLPCKNRCEITKELICQRDKGFILGLALSVILIKFIPIEIINKIDKHILIYMGLSLTMTTIIHGTLRRYFNIFKNHNTITFIVGVLTGSGAFVFALLFITK